MLGKKNYRTPFINNSFILKIINGFLDIYKLQLSYSISNQDLLLSLLFHQYDYSVLIDDKNEYFIRRDIENYYLNKYYLLSNFDLNNMDLINFGKIKYDVPFLLNNKIFLDVKYELKIPYDIIFNSESIIINEDTNSEFKSSQNYLENISLNKNFMIMNYNKLNKFQNYFDKLNILETNNLFKIFENTEDTTHVDKFIKSFKGGKKVSKIKSIKFNNSFLLNFETYYNIYEEKFLNPISDFKPTKYAYCSLYYGNNQYFLDTMLSGYSLYLSGTKFDRILFCTTDILYEQIKQLSRFYNRIFIVKPLDIDPLYFKSENRWYGVFNKLYAFYLDEYEKIFMYDTDMIIQKSEEKNKYDSFNRLDLLFDILKTPCGLCYDKDYILKTNEKIPEKLIDNYLSQFKSRQ